MKEFKLTSWSIDNKTSIYVLTVIITLAGLMAYINLPKEQFPEIVFPQMFVKAWGKCKEGAVIGVDLNELDDGGMCINNIY